MISTELIVALLQLPKVGRKTTKRIIGNLKYKVSDLKDLHDLVKEHAPVAKLPDYTSAEIENAIGKANSIFEHSDKLGVKVISFDDNLYPGQLKKINDFPLIISYKGNIQSLLDKPNVAVIGTRDPSEYGMRLGERLAEVLADRNFNIVSGLAVGCDTAGHKGAIKGGGSTTAVLAHGLDYIYPKENQELAQEILDKDGVWISEYFVKTKAHPNFFVERDRIQAGLSHSVIVVETGIKGGTMHTVKYCEEFNRRLVCLNHPEKYLQNEKVQGNQMLINDGRAYAVSSSEEIDMLSYLVLGDYFASHTTSSGYLWYFYDTLARTFFETPLDTSAWKPLLNNATDHLSEHYKDVYRDICARLIKDFDISRIEPYQKNDREDDIRQTALKIKNAFQDYKIIHGSLKLKTTVFKKFEDDIDLIVKMRDMADQKGLDYGQKKINKEDKHNKSDNTQYNLWQE
ncbi:DNA-processing protein DprA [Chitinophaga sp. S165]|uniref:DNA-processing protein DprA n=1 Tax=Chitinophaga sp. S165 TaxID=2135462 RepID=UPI0011B50F5F|nr:DNA-processing protein DprA [Chitinophaga sp. S165]